MDTKDKSGDSFMPKGSINTETSFALLSKKPNNVDKRNQIFSPNSNSKILSDTYFDEPIDIDQTPNGSQMNRFHK
jgi:hypothetical protein